MRSAIPGEQRRLDELTKDEARDVARLLLGTRYDEAQFEGWWADFAARKQRGEFERSVH